MSLGSTNAATHRHRPGFQRKNAHGLALPREMWESGWGCKRGCGGLPWASGLSPGVAGPLRSKGPACIGEEKGKKVGRKRWWGLIPQRACKLQRSYLLFTYLLQVSLIKCVSLIFLVICCSDFLTNHPLHPSFYISRNFFFPP